MRMILRDALDTPEKEAIWKEAIKALHARIQRVVNKAIAETVDALPDMIEEELQ
jgi:hypothetical protein